MKLIVHLATVAAVGSLLAMPALAQSVRPAPTRSLYSTTTTVLPVVLWTVTGAVIGAVAWQSLAVNMAVTAVGTPAGVMTLGAFANSGAAIGAVVGGVGYLWTR